MSARTGRDWDCEPPVWLAIVFVVLGIALLAGAVFLLGGCRPDSAAVKCPIQPPPDVIHVAIDCLPGPPPPPPGAAVALAGPADGCPAGFGACLSEDSLRALIAYLSSVKRYSQDAWTQCGPQPPNPEE